MELPQTPPCGPQSGVRRIKLFRVGGKEAIGPVRSRCGAERDEPPILRAWARGPSPFPASLSAPLRPRPPSPPLQLLECLFCCCLPLLVVRAVVVGTPSHSVISGSWAWRPPSGALCLRGRHRSPGVFVHSSHNGTGIPNFLRLCTLWAVPPLLCELMSHAGACSFSTVLEM